ncbi:MAG TPA: GDSL-type esterase/lipase family protein [Vicinamibacteria bacterium]|nr:GDSL-type esterase/lipase family protein [Vicinamibacteria bacterium]
MRQLGRRSLASFIMVAAVGVGSAAPVAAATCGEARPNLESIVTAEGLVIAPDGTIYFSQPFEGTNQQYLARYRPPYDQAPETRWVDMGGNALGIMLDPGRNVLYAGSRTLKKLLKITLTEPPVVTALADAEEGINGVTLADDGSVYYSDQNGGQIYRVTPDGAKSRVTTSPITQPNGIAFGPDGKLYVVSWTTTDVTRLTLAGGVETGRDLFATMPQIKGDGIAFDAKGRVYVTASSTLYELTPDGKTVTPLGRSAGANIDFGLGALACSDMYIAGNGQGLRLFRHDTAGLGVPWHRGAPAAVPTVAAPQISFPGQYALSPPDWRFPVWPSGCSRFPAEEKACLAFVASDYGRLARFAAANAALAAPRPGEARVVFFGDSITDNWSKAGYGGFFPGKPYVNRGIGGQTTSQMLVRFRPDVVDIHPRAIVVLAGTNDVAGNSGPIRVEAIEENFATMAEVAKLHGIRVVLASILPVSDEKTDRGGRPINRTHDRPPQTLHALNEWMAGYARQNGHVYLDYFSALVDSNGALKAELTDDGLHPNAKGYAIMAPLAETAIARALAPAR